MRNRLILPTLAISGAIETGYLSVAKLTSLPIAESFCLQGAKCSQVLSSPFAQLPFTDVPLVAVGFIAYSIIAVLAISNLQVKKEDSFLSTTLVAGTSAMATFSIYLMIVLTFVLQEGCTFCYASALISILMAASSWNSGMVSSKTKAFVISATSATVTSFASALLFYFTSLGLSEPVTASTAPAAQIIASASRSETGKTNVPPKVTKHSSSQATLLADQLQSLNAKMYGAYWCSHCFNQKQELGLEALSKVPYIECDKEGVESQFPLCREKKVPLASFTGSSNSNYFGSLGI